VAGVFVVAAVMVLHSPWLSLSTVDIVGSEHADVEGRLASADVGEGAIMLWLSPGEVEEAVVADPWVREARVERVLPDTLVVEVLEHTPALWIEGETGWMLVGRDGSVLEHTDRPGDGLLRVALGFPDHAPGSSPDAPAWREVVSLAVSVPEMAGAELSLDEEGVRSSVSGIPVHFGPPVDLADKGRVLLSVLAEGVPADWSIDLVAPRRPVLVPPSLKDQAELEVEGGASST
jgi:cell division protein FtsQ